MLITALEDARALDFDPAEDEKTADIIAFLEDCPVGDKEGRAVIPATFNPCPVPCRNAGKPKAIDCQGGRYHRLGANVATMTGLGIDLDHQPPGAIARVLEALTQRGIECHWWETFSHAEGADERARLLIPFKEPMPLKSPAQWSKAIWPALVAHVGLNGLASADQACKDPARVYYTPRRPSLADVRRSGYIPGAPLDWKTVDLRGAQAFPAYDSIPARAPVEDASRPVDLAKVRASLAKSDNPLVERLLAGQALAGPPGKRAQGEPSRYEAWFKVCNSVSWSADEWMDSGALLELLRPSWFAECAEDPDDSTEWETVVGLLGNARNTAPQAKERHRKERDAADKAAKLLWAKLHVASKDTNTAGPSNESLRTPSPSNDLLRNDPLPSPGVTPNDVEPKTAAKNSQENPGKSATSKNAKTKNAPAEKSAKEKGGETGPNPNDRAGGHGNAQHPFGQIPPPAELQYTGVPGHASGPAVDLPDEDIDFGAWPEGALPVVDGCLSKEALFSSLETSSTKSGEVTIKNNLTNLDRIFESSPEWRGAFRYNTVSHLTELWRGPIYDGKVRPLEKVDTTEIRLWFAEPENGYQVNFKKEDVDDVMEAAAYRMSYDPIKEYLKGLKWDGTRRVEHMLETYFHADTKGKLDYIRAISKKWMISVAARGLVPGVKVDTTLVFCGGQGAGKTSALAVLGGDFYVEFSYALDSHDALLVASNKWIGEFGELRSLKNAELERTKSFLSRTHDTYRAKYAKNVMDHPRRIVFAASTNDDEIFTDPTGNRRFWAVAAKDVDLVGLKRDRDQLWAEAVMLFEAGEKWHLTTAENALAGRETEELAASDPYAEKIVEWFDERDSKNRPRDLTSLEAARDIFDIATPDGREHRAITTALRSLGFGKGKRYKGGKETRVYVTPEDLMRGVKSTVDRSTRFGPSPASA